MVRIRRGYGTTGDDNVQEQSGGAAGFERGGIPDALETHWKKRQKPHPVSRPFKFAQGKQLAHPPEERKSHSKGRLRDTCPG